MKKLILGVGLLVALGLGGCVVETLSEEELAIKDQECFDIAEARLPIQEWRGVKKQVFFSQKNGLCLYVPIKTGNELKTVSLQEVLEVAPKNESNLKLWKQKMFKKYR